MTNRKSESGANRIAVGSEVLNVNITRSSIRTVAALGIGLALTLAACGGGNDDDVVAGGATTLADDDAAVNSITIADFAFSGVTEIAVGTTIVVTNTDATPHTWTADDGAFDSGALSEGDTFEFTFTEAGEFAYHCNFHPSMTGTIVVTG